MMKHLTTAEIVEEIKGLTDAQKRLVRAIASYDLKQQGVEEIGSSDVSCQVVALYREHGGVDGIIRYGLDIL